MNRKNCFTLSELFAVTFCIVVFMGLLIPAVSLAQTAAGENKCAANLKSLAQANLMYANDNDGWLPNIQGTVWVSFTSGLGEYAGVKNDTWNNDWKELLCPEAKLAAEIQDGKYGPEPSTLEQSMRYSYGYMTALNDRWTTMRDRLCYKVTDAAAPAETGLLGETQDSSQDPFVCLLVEEPSYGMAWRHENETISNVACFDGGVKSLTKAEAEAQKASLFLPLPVREP